MSKSRKSREKAERDRLMRLGEAVRGVVLAVYVERNSTHDNRDWPPELRDFGRETYAAIAAGLIGRGWLAPDVAVPAEAEGVPAEEDTGDDEVPRLDTEGSAEPG